jgi:hypothetical protein
MFLFFVYIQKNIITRKQLSTVTRSIKKSPDANIEIAFGVLSFLNFQDTMNRSMSNIASIRKKLKLSRKRRHGNGNKAILVCSTISVIASLQLKINNKPVAAKR